MLFDYFANNNHSLRLKTCQESRRKYAAAGLDYLIVPFWSEEVGSIQKKAYLNPRSMLKCVLRYNY